MVQPYVHSYVSSCVLLYTMHTQAQCVHIEIRACAIKYIYAAPGFFLCVCVLAISEKHIELPRKDGSSPYRVTRRDCSLRHFGAHAIRALATHRMSEDIGRERERLDLRVVWRTNRTPFQSRLTFHAGCTLLYFVWLRCCSEYFFAI